MVTYRKSDGGTVAIPNWLWGSIGALLLLVAGGAGARVQSVLGDHGAQLNQHSATLTGYRVELNQLIKSDDRTQEKLDRILELLHK